MHVNAYITANEFLPSTHRPAYLRRLHSTEVRRAVSSCGCYDGLMLGGHGFLRSTGAVKLCQRAD